MPHLIRLGDSIFDNGKYTAGGPAVIDQLQQTLTAGWKATLLAVDGDTTTQVPKQLLRLPADATHLVLSVGGNDALGCIAQLEAPAKSVKHGLMVLTQMKAAFHASYRANLTGLLALNKPLMVCTIYDSVPGMPAELRTALALFNDVILREAFQHGLPVLDLRMICTEPADYSVASPIEPSSQGGAKLAAALGAAMTQPGFSVRGCRVYL